MYSPSHYSESRQDLIFRLIDEHPFATLLSLNSAEEITHLPMILERDPSGEVRLLSHMARANPHWRKLEDTGTAKVIFQGPNGYITPSWYAPDPGNVPTWNYAVAHATGRFEIIRSADAAFEAMLRLTERFERDLETPWRLPRDERAIEQLMKAIVVFRLMELEFEAKFKLSQKQNPTDRENVIEQLKARATRPHSYSLAQYMEITRPRSSP